VRGLSDDVLKQFQFGYCPDSVSHDLSGRVIMPLFDAYSKLIAITSRNFNVEKKYQHWHESFDKSAFLYGLNLAKPHILKSGKAIIVEGQFDTTCLHSYGFRMTTGLLGSSFNITHVSLLARLCSEIYLALDPDDSGDAGVERAQKMHKDYCLDIYGILIVPVSLPPKTDPDDFVMKHGSDEFVKILKKAKERQLGSLYPA
jgi:DNA primase